MNVADPYADRHLIDEATHRSLTLCRAIISNPNTDTNIRISCLAKCVSLLDALPKVREFDVQATREIKQKVPSKTLAKPVSDDPHIWPPELIQILLDRAIALKDLATAYRQNGDAQNSAYNFDRAVTLLESFVLASPLFSLAQSNEDTKSIAINTLLQVLGDWADVEQSLGRNAKAAKIRMRTDKWRFRQ
ncbi:hypothetical protein GGH94_000072 [Coemansia aciculifera]|uniref:Uncharacterized protein n=1 Tax=Coemansia aciculifera TaxID=417176 RepID=A0A9W8IRB9_9FUNG|nr:hypothetical protein GGH94_000072 [Coemansia aciculifera]KAJ2877314.1 hypothetical protein GGH93_000055 [Coemansia aciculifera]